MLLHTCRPSYAYNATRGVVHSPFSRSSQSIAGACSRSGRNGRYSSQSGSSARFFGSFSTSYSQSNFKNVKCWLMGGCLAAVLYGLASFLFASGDDEKEKSEEKKKKKKRPQKEEEEPPIITKYLIIGGGTTAHAAVRAIREHDPTGAILIVSDEEYPPYMRPPLSKELWKSDDPNVAQTLTFKDWQGKESQIWLSPDYSQEGSGVDFVKRDSVALLNVEEHEATLRSGKTVKFEKCLIATGGTPFSRFPGEFEFGRHVSTFRNINDFKHLDALTREGEKTIIIAGGGFLGSELAWALARRPNVKLIQIFPESGTMATIFPQYLSDYVTDKLRAQGVDIRPGRLVKYIKGEGDKVTVTLDDQQTVTGDHLILAAGILPNTEIAEMAGLEIDPQNKGIVVNSELMARTDVFAAGDVASYYDMFLGRRRVEHYDHANESGYLAGLNMVGKHKPYLHIPMFWGDLGPMGYEAVGDLNSKYNTVGVWQQEEGKPENNDFKKGIVYYLSPEQRVVGVLLWNLFGKVDDARRAIRRSKRFADLSQLKNEISLEENH